MIGIITLAAFVIGLKTTTEPINGLSLDESKIEVGQTMAFITLALSELVHVFNVRNNKESIFKTGIFNNKTLLGAILISAALIFVIICIPFLRNIFGIPVLPMNNIIELVYKKKVIKKIYEYSKMKSLKGNRLFKYASTINIEEYGKINNGY